MTSSSAAAASKAIRAGARYYGRWTLPLYDAAVLRLVVPLAWQCPLERERQMYDRLVGARHLDVGVASGYFLHHCQWWPVDAVPDITLMDLNPYSTEYAAHRLRQQRRCAVTEVVGDALLPFPIEEGVKFDSIGLFHLLHCIPGNLNEKSSVVLRNAGKVLKPDGVVFGANVTPADCAELNPLARAVLTLSHRLGALNNQNDRHADMEAALGRTFREYKLDRVGCMSLWEARKPKL